MSQPDLCSVQPCGQPLAIGLGVCVAAALRVAVGRVRVAVDGIRVAGMTVAVLVRVGDRTTVGRLVGVDVRVGSVTIALTTTGVVVDSGN